MKFASKFFQDECAPNATKRRLSFVFLMLLIASLDNVCNASNADIDLEQFDRRQDVESRQFGVSNANAAFNSNFGSSGGGSLGGFSGFGNSPSTTAPFNIPSNQPNPNSNTFSHHYNSNKIEINKNSNKGHSAKNPDVRYLDRFNHRYPDGSYEYRYELSDGTARYERGYFLLYDKKKTLVVVGYYSYRLPDGRYITVFYNADQNGYRQNQSITPKGFPNLPRSIEIPESKDANGEHYSKTTTANPRITTVTTRGGLHF